MDDYIALVKKHGGQRAAARELGLARTTLQRRLYKQQEDAKQPQKKPPSPLDKITTIVYFTDAHNQPKLDKKRFFWLADYINEKNPEHLVDGGDFDDLGSLCRHERNESYKGKFKPAFQDDLESANEARQILHEEIKAPCTKYVTFGNHEARLYDYEDANPEVYGMMQHAYEEILHKFGWGITPYRAYKTIDDVDFTHVPMNMMNRPIGGKNPCNIISRDSIKDICFGHTHGLGYQINHKLGDQRSVRAFNGGCFMPDDYMPAYAKNSQKEFWSGVHLLKIINGKLNVCESITMLELSQRYG